MQRKNNILKFSRNGMAMIMALAVIVIVATIMALSLALTTQTTKKTVDLYLYEQSILLSKSATEYALLQIAQSNPCSYAGEQFTHNTLYTIDISVEYIYDDPNLCSASGLLYTTVTNPQQSGSALMDITVSVTPDKNAASEPIRYFRRTIQKL